jgi:hypothetical protein
VPVGVAPPKHCQAAYSALLVERQIKVCPLQSSGTLIRLEGLLPDNFLVLDSIRNWVHHFLVMWRIDFELNGRKKVTN